MEGNESLYPADWREVAGKDWHRMTVLLAEDDAEGAAFFLQQAIEKQLKAFLLENGWKLRKLHDLDTLLDLAVEYNPRLEKFRGLCERVTGYYFTERYPLIVPTDLSSDDLRNDIKAAEELTAVLLGLA